MFSNRHTRGVLPGRARATEDFELSTGKLVKKSGERKSKRQVAVRDQSLHWASGKGEGAPSSP